MLGQHRQLRIQVNQLKDGGIFCLALWLAHYLRAGVLHDLLHLERTIEPWDEFIWLWFVIFPAAPLILESQGFYRRPLFPRRRDTLWILLKSCTMATVGIIIVMFPLKLALARAVIILFGFTAFIVMFGHEELMRHVLRSRLGQAQFRRKYILVGDRQEIEHSRRELAAHPEEGIDAVAELDLTTQPAEALVDLLHQHSANGIIVQGEHSKLGEIEKVVQVCELEGVEAWVVADFFKTRISKKSFDEFHGRPVLVFRTAPEASMQRVLKDVMDLFGAAALLLGSSPLLALSAVLIKLTSPGPILFRQQRCGINGQPFTMLKFRTMTTDAEQRKHELAVFNEMSGPVFKMTNDPRITPIGRLLRKFSVDEFPQLLNVLKGDMSLVGPRPLPVDEVRRFNDLAHRRRLSVKPGLTCLWQVSGRNDVRSFDDWVRMDLEYIDNWSLWLDLWILIKTIPVVLLGKGAK
ncbi:MAG: sugar transferase [Verrucomicrobia bacterium]|nr:sugar transferase [Verrucomicrobiota bacterium]